MTLTYTDIFCGAGGSSIGLTEAGLELKLAANHWERAIATHSANFTDAEHLCADVNNYDMRRLPRTDVLWASPICTEMSPAGGTKTRRRNMDQLELGADGDPIPDKAYERTRATFHDVIRATEVHRYKAVIVENVVDVVWRWELFDWWVGGMVQLGYNAQFVSVSSAHVGDERNPHAPQWRDRFYIVFTQTGIRLPDVTPRPWARCTVCDEDVQAFQSWRGTARSRTSRYGPAGKYGSQYDYRCPSASCGHAIVEPYVLPAAAAIDWSDLGVRVSDRARPLAAATRRRIQAGLEMFGQPTVVANHGQTWERPGSDYVRAWPAAEAPLMARTGTPGDGLASPPFAVNVAHGGDDGRPFRLDQQPLRTRTARIGDGVAVPPGAFVAKNYTPRASWEQMVKPATGDALGAVTTQDHHSLVVPAGGTWRTEPTTVREPLPARTTSETDGLATPFVTQLRNNQTADSVRSPLSTVTAGGRHHGLTVPPGAFIQKHHGGVDYARIEHMTKPITDPLPAVVARSNVSLVIPFRRGARPHRPGDRPLSTVTVKNGHALMVTDADVDACLFRMLKPREHLAAQRFWPDYIVTGSQEEQTAQAGNAVSSNVAHWLGRAVAEAIDSTPAGG